MRTPHVQASIADVTKPQRALAVDPGIPASGVVLQTHDEVIVSVPHGDYGSSPLAEVAFLARRLERISPTWMEMDFSQAEAGIMEQYSGRMIHGVYCGNPGPNIRLGSRKIPRALLSQLGHTYGRRALDDRGTMRRTLRGDNRNMHDVRRWLRDKFAPVATVAGDALEQGSPGRAMAILTELVHLEDATRIVGGYGRKVFADEPWAHKVSEDRVDASRVPVFGHFHRHTHAALGGWFTDLDVGVPYPAADIAAPLKPKG